MSAARLRWLKAVVFLLCLMPLLALAVNVFSGAIAGDPVETMTQVTGEWALRYLLITLALTPVRRILKLSDLIKFRRMLGLYAFFYACCHMAVYVVFDQFFDIAEILSDILERKYIFIGMLALIMMTPLAITSTNGWIRRLGGKRWQQLHRLIYLTGIAAVLHYFWLIKADYTEPVIYGAILAILLAYRLIIWQRKSPR